MTSESQFDYYRNLYPSYSYCGQFESAFSIATNNSQYYVVSVLHRVSATLVKHGIVLVLSETVVHVIVIVSAITQDA